MSTSNDDGTSRANSELAIDCLLNGIKTFGLGADSVDHVFKHVFDAASGLVGRSGKEEDVAVYLEKIVEYIQKTPDLAGSLLHCYILYRVAQLFTQQKHMEEAKQYFYSAQKIAASRRSELEFIKREIGIWENLISIHNSLGEKKQLLDARMEYVNICEPILSSPPAWLSENRGRLLVGVARARFEIGTTHANEEHINIGIKYLQEALRLEKDRKTEAPDSGLQAWILLQLSEFYYSTDSEIGQCVGQCASWNFLEQAIAGLQQVGCTGTCSSDTIDCSSSSLLWEEKGMLDCAHHQLLADAYIFQGRVLQHHGFMVEAQKSFEEGLCLVEQCNDRKREASFHLELAHHLFLESHMYTTSCLHVEDSPQYTKPPFEKIVGHFRDFVKKFTPGVVFEHDRTVIYARAFINAAENPNVASSSNGSYRAAYVEVVLKHLRMAEKRGDYEAAAVYIECLSVHYYRMGDIEACKKHFNLACEYMPRIPYKCTPLRALQTFGWISMASNCSDLELPYHFWTMVFQESLELMIGTSEDHALRYLELNKRACMALAKCQMQRMHKSLTCPDSQEICQSYVESALVWAERGKGRMLMSFIEASTRSTDNPACQIFDTRRFLTDDQFAFNFIGRNTTRVSPLLSQSRKTIFVEYTYIDRYQLMLHVVVDDPISGCTSVQIAGVVCLDCELPERIRRQAEKYLDELVQHRPETAQSSTGSVDTETVLQRVVSAMNKYSAKSRAYNPYIPGMVVGIQKHVGQAIDKLKRDKTSRCMNEKAAISELLQYLFKVLIKPIKKQLDAAYEPGDAIVFLPHEDLGIVPFAALHESEGSRYLIQDYAISVSPSLWCTRHCQHLYEKTARSGCDEGAGSPVLVGKKSGYPPGWNNLKQAHKEVDAVAEAMRSVTASTVLKDTSPDELTQGRLLEILPTASWIHLCVHGEVSSQFPQGSLLFSDNDGQRLTAEQIITLAPSGWRARAVVASACQTGLGAVAGGGILGFARAFILAGVPSAVLTVWEAPATFCTELMKKLYEQLAVGCSLAHAMQKVVILMMHEPKKVRKGDRKGKGKVGKGEDGEKKWTIFDWACLSCFGLPGVTLPMIKAAEPSVEDGTASSSHQPALVEKSEES